MDSEPGLRLVYTRSGVFQQQRRSSTQKSQRTVHKASCFQLMFVAFSAGEIISFLLCFYWYLPVTIVCFILDVFLEIILVLVPAFLALLGAYLS